MVMISAPPLSSTPFGVCWECARHVLGVVLGGVLGAARCGTFVVGVRPTHACDMFAWFPKIARKGVRFPNRISV